MQKIVILGATGSIGKSTLEVIRLHPDKYQVFALSANHNMELLLRQCLEFQPQYAYLANQKLSRELQLRLNETGSKTQVLTKASDLNALASHPEVDSVMSAIVGSAGLLPTYHAACSGKKILLANKESLVAGGAIITAAAKAHNARLIPVDSEHSAIFQALPYTYSDLAAIGVDKIILTASGGPFLHTTQAELQQVNAAAAIQHPNWSMGKKISVDSSTMMNKGLEVIEAYWLFNARLDQIEVVIHPQSIIHSMVEYIDGSIIAQMGTPDMKTPIAYALSAPQRIHSGSAKLNFTKIATLNFSAPDSIRFPCLQLARDSLKHGGAAPTVLNASNEIAVDKFLAGQHGFYAIPQMIDQALNRFADHSSNSIDEVLYLDQEVRKFCLQATQS